MPFLPTPSMKMLPLAFLLGCSAQSAPGIGLKGYFACQAALDEKTGDALACYARTQSGCRNGQVVLAFEKRLSRRDAKAVYQIVDTVHMSAAGPNEEVTLARCTAADGEIHPYFVVFKPNAAPGQKYPANIRHVWGVSAQHKLVEMPLKTLRCLNDDFGAD